MKPKDYTDEELILAFLNETTRHKAFTFLMQKYQERVYVVIRNMVKDHEDADDLTQEVFVKVYHHLAGFKQESQLFTWIYRIAINLCLTFLEKQKRKAVFADEEILEKVLEGKTEEMQTQDSDEMEALVQQAIDSLPEKQKAVFIMRYYDELEYKDIAKILETSEGGLKANYHHAVKKIEEFIKQRLGKD